jgi:predicted RNase H-like HicB family nuclease
LSTPAPGRPQESQHSQRIWYIQDMREFIIYQDDNDQWVAEAKDLPGYRASGKTQEEALEKIKSVLLIYHPCRCEE